MMQGQLYWDLMAIRDRDPDGGDVEPTEVEHECHKLWAVATFGEETWRIYRDTDWDQPDQ